jgi:hypothetical protein
MHAEHILIFHAFKPNKYMLGIQRSFICQCTFCLKFIIKLLSLIFAIHSTILFNSLFNYINCIGFINNIIHHISRYSYIALLYHHFNKSIKSYEILYKNKMAKEKKHKI